MKKIFFITNLLIGSMLIQAQDSWKIKLNDSLLLNTNEENEIKNTKKISPAEWKKNGHLEVNYKESEPTNKWKRSFLFFDKEENQLLSRENVTSIKMPVDSLRKLFAGKKRDQDLYYCFANRPQYSCPHSQNTFIHFAIALMDAKNYLHY